MHTHFYLPNPEMMTVTCAESQHILVVCIGYGHCGRWLITFIVGELAYVLMPHACKINNMLNEVTLGSNGGVLRNICANSLKKMSYNLWLFMSRSMSYAVRDILLKGNYIMYAHGCNGPKGLCNLQD